MIINKADNNNSHSVKLTAVAHKEHHSITSLTVKINNKVN